MQTVVAAALARTEALAAADPDRPAALASFLRASFRSEAVDAVEKLDGLDWPRLAPLLAALVEEDAHSRSSRALLSECASNHSIDVMEPDAGARRFPLTLRFISALATTGSLSLNDFASLVHCVCLVLPSVDRPIFLLSLVPHMQFSRTLCESPPFIAVLAEHLPTEGFSTLFSAMATSSLITQVSKSCLLQSGRAVDGLVEYLVQRNYPQGELNVLLPAISRRVQLRSMAVVPASCEAIVSGFRSQTDSRLVSWARGQAAVPDEVGLSAISHLEPAEVSQLFVQACSSSRLSARKRRRMVTDKFAQDVAVRREVVVRGANARNLAEYAECQAQCGLAIEAMAKSNPEAAAALLALLESNIGLEALVKLTLPKRLHKMSSQWMRAGERLALASMSSSRKPSSPPLREIGHLWLSALGGKTALNTVSAMAGAAIVTLNGGMAVASQPTPSDPDETLVSAWLSGLIASSSWRLVHKIESASLSPWLWVLDLAMQNSRLVPGSLPPLKQQSSDELLGLLRELVFGKALTPSALTVADLYYALARLVLRRCTSLSGCGAEDAQSLHLLSWAFPNHATNYNDALGCELAQEFAKKSPMVVSQPPAVPFWPETSAPSFPKFVSLALDHVRHWLPLGGCSKCSDGSDSNFGFDLIWRMYAWTGISDVLFVLIEGFETGAWQAQVQSQGASAKLSVVASRVVANMTQTSTPRIVNLSLRLLGTMTRSGPAARSSVVESMAWPFIVNTLKGERGGPSERVNSAILLDEVCQEPDGAHSGGLFKRKDDEKLLMAERNYSLCSVLLGIASVDVYDQFELGALSACSALLTLLKTREGSKVDLVSRLIAFMESKAVALESGSTKPDWTAVQSLARLVEAAMAGTPLLFELRSRPAQVALKIRNWLAFMGLTELSARVSAMGMPPTT